MSQSQFDNPPGEIDDLNDQVGGAADGSAGAPEGGADWPSDEDLFEEEVLRRRGLMTGEEGGDQPGQGDGGQGDAGVAAEQPPASGQQVAQRPPSGQQVGQQAGQNLQPAAGQSVPEWWASLTPEVQQYIQETRSELGRVNQMYSALHGRLAPVQQDNARLTRQLQTLQQQTPPAGNSGNGSQSPRATTATLAAATNAEDLESSEFAEFAKTFPEEARVIEAMVRNKTGQIESLVQRVGDLSTQLESIQQNTLRQTRETELYRLTDAHPDWAAVRNSEDFNLWVASQPPAVQQLVDSSRADDCIWLIDSYKSNVYIRQTLGQQGAAGGQQGNSTLVNRGTPNPNVQEATATRARRQAVRRLATPEPQGGQVGIPRGQANTSDEEIWAAEVERRIRAHSQQSR